MYKSHHTRSASHHDINLYKDIEKIKAALADASDDVKNKASELFFHSLGEAKERTSEIEEDITNYLAEKPLKSLGIALLGGIAVGYFLSNRK